MKAQKDRERVRFGLVEVRLLGGLDWAGPDLSLAACLSVCLSMYSLTSPLSVCVLVFLFAFDILIKLLQYIFCLVQFFFYYFFSFSQRPNAPLNKSPSTVIMTAFSFLHYLISVAISQSYFSLLLTIICKLSLHQPSAQHFHQQYVSSTTPSCLPHDSSPHLSHTHTFSAASPSQILSLQRFSSLSTSYFDSPLSVYLFCINYILLDSNTILPFNTVLSLLPCCVPFSYSIILLNYISFQLSFYLEFTLYSVI